MRSRLTVLTPRRARRGRRRGMWPALLVLGAISFGFSATARAADQMVAPPGLPGPPPGAGSGLPTSPLPGTAPTTEAGPAAWIPTHVAGPALMTGVVRVHGSQFALAIACRTSGRVSVTAGAIRPGVLARGTYTCRNGHANAQLVLRGGDARRLAASGSTLASVTLGQGNGAARLSLTLQTTDQSPRFWSDGGLECNLLGSFEPYLVAPNFTAISPLDVEVRPWVAWYTSTVGWRWLGTVGSNASQWYRWTATPSGVAQWKTPAGAMNRWTWSPISVSPGHGTYAVGVFEVVYGSARYTWGYSPSNLVGSGLATYCRYP